MTDEQREAIRARRGAEYLMDVGEGFRDVLDTASLKADNTTLFAEVDRQAKEIKRLREENGELWLKAENLRLKWGSL